MPVKYGRSCQKKKEIMLTLQPSNPYFNQRPHDTKKNGVTVTKIHYINFGEIKLGAEAFVKCTYATLTV